MGALHLFCAILPWSRYHFMCVATDERRATTLALLTECFEDIGGHAALETKLRAIVALESAWGRGALVPALERATMSHRFTAADVRSILAAGAGAPTAPRRHGAGNHLPIVPVRALSAYALERLS